jgi:hypothetical protein
MDSCRTALSTTVDETLETLSIHIHTCSGAGLKKIAQSALFSFPQPGPARPGSCKFEGKNEKAAREAAFSIAGGYEPRVQIVAAAHRVRSKGEPPTITRHASTLKSY